MCVYVGVYVYVCMQEAVHEEAISVCGFICRNGPKSQVPHEDASLSILDLLKFADDGIKMVTYPGPDGRECSLVTVKGSNLHCIFSFHSGKSKREPISSERHASLQDKQLTQHR